MDSRRLKPVVGRSSLVVGLSLQAANFRHRIDKAVYGTPNHLRLVQQGSAVFFGQINQVLGYQQLCL